MTCITKDLLLKFFAEAPISLRALVHYRVVSVFGKPFDYYLLEESCRVYEVLEKALGRHNADLITKAISDWLRKNGCSAAAEEVKKALSEKSYWSK